MRSLPSSDPRSLIRQTWLHGYYCDPEQSSINVHNTWAFLPWHRAFLYYHEQILGNLIGKPDFRLPYWDWDQNGTIPPCFIDLGLPDFLTGTAGRAQPGPAASWADRCSLQAWLLSENFTEFVGTDKGPGHAFTGPHGQAHTSVGGAMRNPLTAAADPVFFAHHANVDRFWSYWQSRYPFKPPNDSWGRQEFFFHDAQCRLVKVTAHDVDDIGRLGYKYVDLPTVPLCPFESVAIKVASDLKHLTLADLIATGSSSPQKVSEFLKNTVQHTKLLRPECFLAFPLQTTLTLPVTDLTPGNYYVVGAMREKFYKIGGFGVFASKMHLQMEKEFRVIATGCLDPELYAAFLNKPDGFELRYAESKDGTNPNPSTLRPIKAGDWVIKLLYPKGYVDSAKDLLRNFLAP